MKVNMATADRALRVIIAVAIAILYFMNIIAGTAGLILLVAGVIFLATSIIGFCPLYKLFGFSTCKTETK